MTTQDEKKTGRLGIQVGDDPYSRGYWARFDDEPRPKAGEAQKGWDDCDEELRFEAGEIVGEPEESPLICPQWGWA